MLLLALASGCSAGVEADLPSGALPPRKSFWGGQTGSLMPKCGAVAEVPEGASGIVVDTRGCALTPTGADVRLTTEAGEAIATEWIPLGGGRYLIRPTQSLDRGQYRVSVAGSSQAVQIGASSPKPTRLGTLERLASSDCDLSVDVRLDDAVLPYGALLRVEAMLDGETHLLADYGALTAENTTVAIRCTNCLSRGTHALVAFGEIAGEPSTLASDTLTLDSTCSSTAFPEQDSSSGCGIARVPGSGAGGVWGGLMLGLLVLMRAVRARKTGGS